MSKLKVLVTIKSNKIQAKADGIHYKSDFNDNNHYQVSFEAYVLENSKLRFSNIDPKEQFPVQRISDNEIIWCYYNQFSNFVIEEDGGGGDGGDASTLNGQAGSYYLNRSNHTGTQLASTISDFQNQVSLNADVLENTANRHTHSNKSILDNTTASFLIADRNKLDTIEENATVGADWDTNLINKPILGTAASADINDFATAAQGALAETAVQPSDLPVMPTWTTISGKPAFVAEGANAADARTALGLGTAATTDSTAYATAAQGALANTAVQPATIADVVRSQQEESVGVVITNIVAMTQAQYDGLTSPSASTYYIITD